MVLRPELKAEIENALRRSRVVSLVGPRQSGKTTLAHEFLSPDAPGYFDLEDTASAIRLSEAKSTLAPLRNLIVIDEIQRQPELFQLLRVLADRKPLPAKFLILGSASPHLIKHSSESLAGRIESIDVTGFNLKEVGAENLDRHWLRGGFPMAFLAATEKESALWRKKFIQSFLDRDLPGFGMNIPPVTMFRFWRMLAHYHGQIWNASQIASAMGFSAPTARRYLDILTGTYLIRQLHPWHENLKKRQVKSPKIYFRDSGIYHSLINIGDQPQLFLSPSIGASWEGYAIEEAIRHFQPDEAYFWAVQSGAELDLLLFKDGKRIGVECKRRDAPRMTPSMKTALHDLKLDELFVLYPGTQSFQLAENVHVRPLISLAE
jgi:predicted AAA+ superfamily ATPase